MAFSRSVKSDQRLMRMLVLEVDGTGTASLAGPSYLSASLTDNGTGDYTVTFDVKFLRAPKIFVTPSTAGIVPQVFNATTSLCQVKTFDTAGVATDADFHLLVIGSDAVDAI